MQLACSQPEPLQPDVLKHTATLKMIASLPKNVAEASGLEITSSGLLWTHNDDRFPVLYGCDTLGNVAKVVHLNHSNNGWEDLTQDEDGNLYIGAFGNNKNDRRNLSILKLPQPDKITDRVFNAELIEFTYEDQDEFPPPPTHRNFDADAFVSIGDSLYIFTKNRTEPFTGYTKIYRLPSSPGKYRATLYDSIYLGNGSMMENWVTSADISPDREWLALLSHDRIWLVKTAPGKRFSAGQIFSLNLGAISHKAGLCFASNTLVYIVDELEFGFLGGKLYSLDLTEILHDLD